MNDHTKVSLTTRASVRPVQGLLAGTLLAVALPALAADAVASAKKSSASAADKVPPNPKPTPQKVTAEDKGGVREPRGPVPPKHPHEGYKKPIKSNEKAKSKVAAGKEALPLENTAPQK
jgi:hypothetical protein